MKRADIWFIEENVGRIIYYTNKTTSGKYILSDKTEQLLKYYNNYGDQVYFLLLGYFPLGYISNSCIISPLADQLDFDIKKI